MRRSHSIEECPALVLLVADHPLIRTMAARALRAAEFEVLEAENADIALRLIGHLASSIAVVFTDLRMDGRNNGVDRLAYIHECWPWIALLLASSHRQPDAADLPPGTCLLGKPYKAADLIHQISDLTRRDRPQAARTWQPQRSAAS